MNPPTIDYLIKGKHAVIENIDTFWNKPSNSLGIKLGTVLVPNVSITLGAGVSTGALRIYIRNAENISVGDPISVSFENGEFLNGLKAIDLNGSDGFHEMIDFYAYKINMGEGWTVSILEAENDRASGYGYKKLINIKLNPVIR